MKVAVIGIGRLGQRHLEKWTQIEGIEIVGVMARSEEKLQAISKQYETNFFTDIQTLVKQTDVDVIDICTPTDTHYQFIKEVAYAGKDIICEKPLALTTCEANDLIELCAKKQVQLFIGHTLQFFPAYRAIRTAIANQEIGKLKEIRLSRGVPFPADTRKWYVDENKSGGLFLDLGVHEFEWVCATFGKPLSVKTDKVKYAKNDQQTIIYGIVEIQLEIGLAAYIELSWNEEQFRSSLEITGEAGMIIYHHTDEEPIFIEEETGRNTPIAVKNQLKIDPYVKQLNHFIQCIKGKEEAILSIQDAADAIALAEAATKSAREDRIVYL